MEEKQYKITFRNFWRHFHVVNVHRWKVFTLCCRVGIPWQGLLHDMSKYTPVEFWEGVKYFQGEYSPIRNCKEVNGYSKAWLHHKGRNKHHYEYWYDYAAPNETPNMPFKYFLELICDNLAAGMTYQGKNWTKDYQLTYWNRVKDKARMSPEMKALIEKVFVEIKKQGLKPVLKKKLLKAYYQEFIKE